MTAEELIKELQKYPKHKVVFIPSFDFNGAVWCPVVDVSLCDEDDEDIMLDTKIRDPNELWLV